MAAVIAEMISVWTVQREAAGSNLGHGRVRYRPSFSGKKARNAGKLVALPLAAASGLWFRWRIWAVPDWRMMVRQSPFQIACQHNIFSSVAASGGGNQLADFKAGQAAAVSAAPGGPGRFSRCGHLYHFVESSGCRK
jgi:hypothetical protein